MAAASLVLDLLGRDDDMHALLRAVLDALCGTTDIGRPSDGQNAKRGWGPVTRH